MEEGFPRFQLHQSLLQLVAVVVMSMQMVLVMMLLLLVLVTEMLMVNGNYGAL